VKSEGRNPKPEGNPKAEIRVASSPQGLRSTTADVRRFTFVAIGSNLGDRHQNVTRAMARLAELSDQPLLKSSLYETQPVDCPPGSPPFVNAVVGLMPRPDETPESLLARLQALERESGRQRKKALNEPRPLDLDLIAFGGERRATAELTLPHPRAHQRRFVLEPLSELAPKLILPGQVRTVAELLCYVIGAQSSSAASTSSG
jgi:2-amino-4-hydroxy-6-hydroxymethyldihydropteridine diphosphokinase